MAFIPVLGVWGAIVFFAVLATNRRIRTLEATHGFNGVGMFGPIVPYGYVVLLGVWPLAIDVAIYWLRRRPELARQARITMFFALGIATFQLGVPLLLVLTWARR